MQLVVHRRGKPLDIGRTFIVLVTNFPIFPDHIISPSFS